MNALYTQISELSFDDFQELLKFVDKDRKERQKKILNEAQKKVARLDLDIDGGRRRKSAGIKKPAKPAKYRDPKNPTATWSGFGRKPDWFKAHLDAGGQEKDLLI